LRGKSRCKITQIASGKKQPYHLISEDGGGVHGWVAAVDVTSNSVFVPYLVKVTSDSLNIYKGASTNTAVVGCIKDKGVYTIVDEVGGFGKLKSGAGWIELKNTQRR
jgi:hypothetical protein